MVSVEEVIEVAPGERRLTIRCRLTTGTDTTRMQVF
jgi:hypothetical protein